MTVRPPAPLLVSAPVPPMALATVTLSERLKTSVPLSVTAPLPSVPMVPPSPICKVLLPLMVVEPL